MSPYTKNIEKAYYAFCEKINNLSPPKHSGIFDNILTLEMHNRIPMLDVIYMRKISSSRLNSLDCAKKGNHFAAELYLSEADAYIDKLSNEDAILISKSFTQSAKAFLYYKQKKEVEAQYFLDNSLEYDTKLINEFKYFIIDIHRVQTIHNIIRMNLYGNSPNIKDSLLLAEKLVKYLLRKGKFPYLKHDVVYDSTLLPDELLESMLCQIVTEIAINTFDERFNIEFRQSELLNPFFLKNNLQFSERITKWLNIKSLYYDESKTNEYLLLSQNYLENYSDKFPILWYTLSYDLANLAKTVQKNEIYINIITHLNSVEYLPILFKTNLKKITE